MRKIEVSKRVERYYIEDGIDIIDLAHLAESNGGYAQLGMYCADVVNDTIYIRTESEKYGKES